MVSVSKYLKDTEDAAPHVSVSVILDTFQKYLPQPCYLVNHFDRTVMAIY